MAIPSFITLFPLNEQLLGVDGLSDGLDGTPLNAATVTVTLVDSSGKVADPAVNGLRLYYVSGSNGNYRGVVPGSFNAPLGNYILQVNASQQEPPAVAYLEIPVSVQERSK